MTPSGARLKLALEDEEQRMRNEWFVKWHYIGGPNVVEIDSFCGEPIRYSGIAFSNTAHLVYWNTIQLYLQKKISDLFGDLERQLSGYPIDTRQIAIDEATYLISEFASRIRRIAVEKDRVLRGDGRNFPEAHDFGAWRGCGASDIKGHAAALLDIYCRNEKVGLDWLMRANQWCKDRVTGILPIIILIFRALRSLFS